jgi:hypothetical protein
MGNIRNYGEESRSSQLPGYIKFLKKITDGGKLEINAEFKEITEMTKKEEEKLQRIKTENPNHYKLRAIHKKGKIEKKETVKKKEKFDATSPCDNYF